MGNYDLHMLITRAAIICEGVWLHNGNGEVEQWEKENKIFSICFGGITFVPKYCVDKRGVPVAEIATIMAMFEGRKDAWGLALWFASHNDYLGGDRPQDLLRIDPEWVLSAVRHELSE